jgi:hypothetical protein
MHATHS